MEWFAQSTAFLNGLATAGDSDLVDAMRQTSYWLLLGSALSALAICATLVGLALLARKYGWFAGDSALAESIERLNERLTQDELERTQAIEEANAHARWPMLAHDGHADRRRTVFNRLLDTMPTLPALPRVMRGGATPAELKYPNLPSFAFTRDALLDESGESYDDDDTLEALEERDMTQTDPEIVYLRGELERRNVIEETLGKWRQAADLSRLTTPERRNAYAAQAERLADAIRPHVETLHSLVTRYLTGVEESASRELSWFDRGIALEPPTLLDLAYWVVYVELLTAQGTQGPATGPALEPPAEPPVAGD